MRRLVVVTACGALACTIVEFGFAKIGYRGGLPLASTWRLATLALALGVVWWLLLLAGTAAMQILARLLRPIRRRCNALPVAMLATGVTATTFVLVWRAHLWATLHFREPVLTGAMVSALAAAVAACGLALRAPQATSTDGVVVRTEVPWLWAIVVSASAVFVASWRMGVIAMVLAPQRAAVVVAGVAAIAAALVMATLPWLNAVTLTLGELLAPQLRGANPLARRRAALFALMVAVASALFAAYTLLPQLRSVLAGRDRLLLAMGVSVLALAQALAVVPTNLRWPRWWPAPAVVIVTITVGALTQWGNVTSASSAQAKYAALTGSPLYERLIALIRTGNDFDRDGYGSLLGERDCAPFDKSVFPGARDIPDNGRDENCDGRDFSLRDLEPPPGGDLPVPAGFVRKDWNVLLLTVDTVRYDRTTFGGYRDGPAKRDTTPNLAKFADRSVAFTFAQAPSAGTMASIPAIITSKFFHSGVALEMTGVPHGMPPRLTAANLTLPEIMKAAGYYTGVIATHEYWNDWGMDQGVDSYDNSIGAKADPFRVVADKTTNHILSFVSAHQNEKWFLWAHYIDPHGRYVAHPDVVDWGTSEPDMYDSELRWTDQEIGRMFDELSRIPGGDRTIIVLTSDHGESMGEHNVPSGTHGTALYNTLLHVPFMIYVPNNLPRQVAGAVTNLDIVPTIAELTGIDVSEHSFEGRSLVPQIFYGKADLDRIVFAETNAPTPERAAISERYRYIYYLQNNIVEFYDRKTDPNELNNLATAAPAPFQQFKDTLNAWLERVVFSRDPTFNQVVTKMADVLLKARPTDFTPSPGVSLDEGAIDVLGYSVAANAKLTPGAKVDIHVFFECKRATQQKLRFGITLWPRAANGLGAGNTVDSANAQRVFPRTTIGGLFGAERWRAGEFVRERFTITIPATWTAASAGLGLTAQADDSRGVAHTGTNASNESNLIILGDLPVTIAIPAGSGSSAP